MRRSAALFFRQTMARLTEDELRLRQALTEKLRASSCEVKDVSGGCGAMYKVYVKSPMFQGLTRVKQHQLVAQTLDAETKDAHGWTIQTEVDKGVSAEASQ
eukprot:EG_transcript_41443